MTVVKTALAAFLPVFLLVFAHLIAADREDNTEFTTDVFVSSMMNGRPWVKLDPQSKIMYLVGLQDGASLLIAEMDGDPNEKDNARAAYPALERLMVKGFMFSDVMEEIDSFYEQRGNRRIPVVDVYRYVLKKFKGASAEELAAARSDLRKKYGK